MNHDKFKLKVYLEHRATLIDYATPITGCRAIAEDIVQEAYFRFVPESKAAAEQGPEAPRQPAAYLYRTVRNLALDWVRRLAMEGRHQQEENVPWLVPAASPQPDQTALHDDQVKQVAAGLAELSDMARRAVEMRRFDGCTLEQIAAELGVSQATVHRLIRDAMTKIARRLDLGDS